MNREEKWVDAVGNRTQLVNFNGSQTITTTYSYNNLNQLTARTVSAGPDQGSWTYGYDANGNIGPGEKERQYYRLFQL